MFMVTNTQKVQIFRDNGIRKVNVKILIMKFIFFYFSL